MTFALLDLIGLKLAPGAVPFYGNVHGKRYPESIPWTLMGLCFANSLLKLSIPLILQQTYETMSAQSVSHSQYLLLIGVVVVAIALSQLVLIAYGLVLCLYRFNVKRELSSRILSNNFHDYRNVLQSPMVDLKTEHANMELWMKIGTKLSVYLHNYYESWLSLYFECFNIVVILIYLTYKLSFLSLFLGLTVAGAVMYKTIRIAARMNDIRFSNIDLRKRRLRILEQFLSRIAQFKMCWLDKWIYERVTRIESQFQAGLRKIKLLDCWCVALWQFTSVGISAVVICTYYMFGFDEGVDKASVLTPSTFVYFLNMLNFPLNALSWYIAGTKTAERAIEEIKRDVRLEQEVSLPYKKIIQQENSICVTEPIELRIKREHQMLKMSIPVRQFITGRIYSIIGQFSEQLMEKLVFLFDENISKSYVEENAWLSPSAIDTICMEQSLQQIQKADRKLISVLMQLFECHDIPLGTNTQHYSGGEKLRISLVRAFNLGDVIVLNTNLNSLDQAMKVKVMNNIRGLVDGMFTGVQKRYTVFVRDNEELADEIIYLNKGKSGIQLSFTHHQNSTVVKQQPSHVQISSEISSYITKMFVHRVVENQRAKSQQDTKIEYSQSQKREKSLVTLDTFKIYYTSKKHIVFAVSMIFVTVLSNYYNYFINTHIDFSEYHPVHMVSIIAMTLLLAVGLFFRSYYFADANLDEASRICHNLNQNIIMQQLSFYQSEQTRKQSKSTNSKSKLICALTSDTETIADHFPFSTNIFANNITVIISSVVVILIEVPQVFLLMLLLVYYCNYLNRTSHKWDEDMKMALKEKDVKVYRMVSDIEGGRKYLIIHNKFTKFSQLYSKLREEMMEIEWMSEKYRSYINLKYKAVMILFLLTAVAVYSFFNVVSQTDLMGVGSGIVKSSGLALLIQYTIQLSNYLLHFTMSLWEIRGQALSIERVRPYLEQKDSITRRIQSSEKIVTKIKAIHEKNNLQQRAIAKLIDIRTLTFAYESNPDTLIFKELDFTVNTGDKIIIKGRSGAGKTTLYKLLTSAYPHVIDLIESSHLISFSPQHPLQLPDTENISQIMNPYGVVYQLPELDKEIDRHGLANCQYQELTYDQKIVVNNLRAYLYGYKGLVIYDEPQLVIDGPNATYVIVTHHHDFIHNYKFQLVDGKLLQIE